jgi:hypothetical protein
MEYGEIIMTFLSSGKFDHKGREIGYAVVFRDNGTDFRCYVQNTRKVNGEWVEFGVPQRSRSFESQEVATNWGYKTAKERLAK